jgi:hypothetical protein
MSKPRLEAWGGCAPESRRLATLMGFAITAAEREQDNALEHFDRLHGDLLLHDAAAGKPNGGFF